MFTRNPLILSIAGTGQYVYSVHGQGWSQQNPAYMGEVTAPVKVNLSEILEAVVPNMADPGISDEILVVDSHDYSVFIIVYDSEQQRAFTRTVKAHRGGVSKQNFRKLMAQGTDIFKARFLQAGCNFFLTTRTNDWRLSIKETELYPLAFFYPQWDDVVLRDPSTGETLELDGTSGALCFLNLEAARRYFLDEYGCIVNVLDVLVDDTYCARIAIEEARPQRERYLLKFRNSFGAFEVIELTGAAQFTPAFGDESDNGQYQRYVPDVDDFAAERPRMEMSNVIKISTGYKTNDELRFILDALASDEIYLLGLTDDPIRVIVTAEELSYERRPNSPQAFNLEIKPVEDDRCITPEMSDSLAPGRGGVFSEEFSEEFD